MTDWLFLSYDHPDHARSRQARRTIRAHITSRQHALNRQSPPKTSSSGDAASKPHEYEDEHGPLSASRSSTSQLPSRPGTQTSSAKPRLRPKPPSPHISRLVPDEEDEALDGNHSPKTCSKTTRNKRPRSTTTTSIPTEVDLNVVPVPRRDWYEWLHDYWFEGTLPKAKGRLKVNDDQLRRYISWTRRLQITEPAMYYMSLLLATGIPVSNGQFPLVKALWLRGCAIAAINEALDDPERATSDALIQAVGFVALHEHIYGDRTAAHEIHRPAQNRMIKLRGGIERLDLPMEVRQIMVWYDTLMASEAGNEPYFESFTDGQRVKAYSSDEAIAVTNNASPYRNKHPGYSLPADVEFPPDD
ncbi:hypothetical protein M409DRAFT_17190 [Zasmidium cellare ATCC 36951]|uniref:Uncharacterized protein n=1 Tax=Zasmidium cellare ATCC 36951 TaxID=1080233 RepID=A0A6A6D6F4_ZASCE|nr:uncharacterized protein M409DRAFT_17190 [Zasmidium cellare ATCC 36951]KAF2173246.1 hypothetical protein M409DRAFT_17190 [Zasmidium cellare ATCC 36951]